MSDCISREAAIGEMADMFKEVKKCGNEAEDDEIKTRAISIMSALIEVKLRLGALPSVNPSTNSTTTNIGSTTDCISREAAIQAVTHFDDLIKRLYVLPPVKPSWDWIPCKKELPPEGKEVMLSIHRFKDRYVIIGYMAESPYFGKYYKNAAEDRTYAVEEVEAWMLPPEVYQEDTE